jgi:hypothetical protein
VIVSLDPLAILIMPDLFWERVIILLSTSEIELKAGTLTAIVELGLLLVMVKVVELTDFDRSLEIDKVKSSALTSAKEAKTIASTTITGKINDLFFIFVIILQL